MTSSASRKQNRNVNWTPLGANCVRPLNLHNVAAQNCRSPLGLPLEGAVHRTEGILLKNKYSALRHTSSVSQARHLLLKEKAIFYCQQCVLSGRTQFAPTVIILQCNYFMGRQGRRPLQYALITCVCLSLPLTREVAQRSCDGGREKESK